MGLEEAHDRGVLGIPSGSELLEDEDSRWLESISPGPHEHSWVNLSTSAEGWGWSSIACSTNAEVVPWNLERARADASDDPALEELARRYLRMHAAGERDFGEIVRAISSIVSLPVVSRSSGALESPPEEAEVVFVTNSIAPRAHRP